MLINTNTTIKNINGQTMKEDDGTGKAVDVTIKAIIVNAVLSPVQKELGIDKVKKYELAKRIFNATEVDLNEDDIKLIKERVGDIYTPLVVGQIYELLRV